MARTLSITGPPATPFELRYPTGWRKLTDAQLDRVGGTRPVAAIRRTDARGIVTLTLHGRLAGSLADLREEFVRALNERFGDVEVVTATEIETEAGPAMYASWIVRDERRVQANLTVPAGDHSYALDAALPLGAADVARDVGAILGGFSILRPSHQETGG